MLKKHPRALAFIFFTEMWERVGLLHAHGHPRPLHGQGPRLVRRA